MLLPVWLIVVLMAGEVRDAVTRVPVGGAAIEVAGSSISVLTDSAGRFRLEVPEGARVRITRTGYAPMDVASRADTALQILLTPLTRALEKVTITAIRGASAERAPITQHTISAATLEQRYSGQEVPLLLAETPGITAYADGGAFSNYTYFRIRGIDQTRINITLDGIPLNDAEDQGVFFSNFPDFGNSVQSVQVQRGVGTSSLGTASYAGSVNFESFSLAQATRRGELQVSRGSFNTTRTSGEWQQRWNERLAGYGRFSWQDTDGYRNHSGNRSSGGFASVGYYGDRTIVKLVALGGVSRNQLSYLASSEDDIRRNPRVNPLSDSDRFWQSVAGLSVTHQVRPQQTLGVTAYNVAAAGDYDVTFDGTVSNFNLASTMTGVFATFSGDWGGANLTVGAHGNKYHRDHFMFTRPDLRSRVYSNRGDKDEASAFAKLSVESGRATWFADLQIRQAAFAYTPDRNAGIEESDIDWTFVNPKVGVGVRLTPRWWWYAAYGSNGREPTRNDIFAGFDNMDTTNAAFVGPLDRVRSERVRDAESGVSYDGQSLTLTANVFDMRFRNEITPIGELSYIGLPLRKNVGSSYRRGLELEGAFRMPRLAINGNATWSRSRIAEYTDDASGQTYRDVEPLLTPSFVMNHRLSIALPRAGWLHLDGRYVGKSFLANTGDPQFVLPAAYTADAALVFDIGAHAILVQVRNVTDRLTYTSGYTDGTTSYYYVLAGRNLIATVRLGLGG
ncbi:MAG: TonB-dependent receptor [Gemmatimonadaceae bacterium]